MAMPKCQKRISQCSVKCTFHLSSSSRSFIVESGSGKSNPRTTAGAALEKRTPDASKRLPSRLTMPPRPLRVYPASPGHNFPTQNISLVFQQKPWIEFHVQDGSSSSHTSLNNSGVLLKPSQGALLQCQQVAIFN